MEYEHFQCRTRMKISIITSPTHRYQIHIWRSRHLRFTYFTSVCTFQEKYQFPSIAQYWLNESFEEKKYYSHLKMSSILFYHLELAYNDSTILILIDRKEECFSPQMTFTMRTLYFFFIFFNLMNYEWKTTLSDRRSNMKWKVFAIRCV
jgi:hypothetical protein